MPENHGVPTALTNETKTNPASSASPPRPVVKRAGYGYKSFG